MSVSENFILINLLRLSLLDGQGLLLHPACCKNENARFRLVYLFSTTRFAASSIMPTSSSQIKPLQTQQGKNLHTQFILCELQSTLRDIIVESNKILEFNAGAYFTSSSGASFLEGKALLYANLKSILESTKAQLERQLTLVDVRLAILANVIQEDCSSGDETSDEKKNWATVLSTQKVINRHNRAMSDHHHSIRQAFAQFILSLNQGKQPFLRKLSFVRGKWMSTFADFNLKEPSKREVNQNFQLQSALEIQERNIIVLEQERNSIALDAKRSKLQYKELRREFDRLCKKSVR